MEEDISFIGSVWVLTVAVVGTAEASGYDDIEVVEAESEFTFLYSFAWWIVALIMSFSFLA